MLGFDMSNVNTWNEAVQTSFAKAFDQIASLGPKVLAMVVILVIGYFVAKLLDRLATALCQSVGLQTGTGAPAWPRR